MAWPAWMQNRPHYGHPGSDFKLRGHLVSFVYRAASLGAWAPGRDRAPQGCSVKRGATCGVSPSGQRGVLGKGQRVRHSETGEAGDRTCPGRATGTMTVEPRRPRACRSHRVQQHRARAAAARSAPDTRLVSRPPDSRTDTPSRVDLAWSEPDPDGDAVRLQLLLRRRTRLRMGLEAANDVNRGFVNGARSRRSALDTGGASRDDVRRPRRGQVSHRGSDARLPQLRRPHSRIHRVVPVTSRRRPTVPRPSAPALH